MGRKKKQKVVDPKALKISEVFDSIQGEGFWTGTPCLFVRFAGCNLKCPWCDTKYAWKPFEELDVGRLLARIQAYVPRTVVLTGGEPTIQNPESMLKLVAGIKHKIKAFIMVETNGVEVPQWILQKDLIDWVTVSPKRGSEWRTYHASEIKVVYDNHTTKELEEFEVMAMKRKLPLFLQPKDNNQEEIEKCIKIIKKRNFWRLSLQIHKILDIK